MRYLFTCIICLILFACNNDTVNNNAVKTPVAGDTSVKLMAKKDNLAAVKNDTVPKNIQVDTVMHLAFEKDSSSLTAKGCLNKKSEPVICYLPVDRHATIIAQLVPKDKDLNIRFSQIIMPDGQSDGPFTRSIKYELKQKGLYKLIISPNHMADGKKSGDFLLQLKVKA